MNNCRFLIHFRKDTFSALPSTTQVIVLNQPKSHAGFYRALNSFVESHYAVFSKLCEELNYDFCFFPHTFEKLKDVMGQSFIDAIRYCHPDAPEMSDFLVASEEFNLSEFISDDDGDYLLPGLICYAGDEFDMSDRYTFFYQALPDSVRKALILGNLALDDFSGFLSDFIRLVESLGLEGQEVLSASFESKHDIDANQSTDHSVIECDTDWDDEVLSPTGNKFSLDYFDEEEESIPLDKAESSINNGVCLPEQSLPQAFHQRKSKDTPDDDAQKVRSLNKARLRSPHRMCLNRSQSEPAIPLVGKTFSKVGAAIGGLVNGLLAKVSSPSVMSLAAASSMFSDRTDTNFADLNFSDEVKDKLIKFKALAQELINNGIEGWLLEKLLRPTRQLSRLHIHGVRIFLTDYNNLEIEMGPLPKTVFFFYLRHPEGVRFRDLRKHRDELWRIYGLLNTKEDQAKAQKSIDELVDSTTNRINEKVNAIQKAFVTKFDAELAKYYYITGQRATAKKIILDRSLVTWDGILKP